MLCMRILMDGDLIHFSRLKSISDLSHFSQLIREQRVIAPCVNTFRCSLYILSPGVIIIRFLPRHLFLGLRESEMNLLAYTLLCEVKT